MAGLVELREKDAEAYNNLIYGGLVYVCGLVRYASAWHTGQECIDFSIEKSEAEKQASLHSVSLDSVVEEIDRLYDNRIR